MCIKYTLINIFPIFAKRFIRKYFFTTKIYHREQNCFCLSLFNDSIKISNFTVRRLSRW